MDIINLGARVWLRLVLFALMAGVLESRLFRRDHAGVLNKDPTVSEQAHGTYGLLPLIYSLL